MPIVGDTPITPTGVVTPTISITPKEYRSPVVDSTQYALSDLAVYMEGHAWTVWYYSQLTDQDSAVGSLSPTTPAPYQQYQLIRDLELKVTSPLASSTNTETQAISITGESSAYGMLKPNVGDMFIADVGDGRAGLFELTRVERRTILKDTIYTIEYVLKDFEGETHRRDLALKVVKTVYFEKDFILHGQNPLVVESEFVLKNKLQEHYALLRDMFLQEFVSNEYRTLLIPSQLYVAYDMYLTETILSLFNVEENNLLFKIRQINCGGRQEVESFTLWDAVLRRDRVVLMMARKRMHLIDVSYFVNRPAFDGVFYSGIKKVLHPIGLRTDVDNTYVNEIAILGEPLSVGLTRAQQMGEFEPPAGAPLPVPLIHPVTTDEYYVLSEAFYNRTEIGQSLLELEIQKLVDNLPNDSATVDQLCRAAVGWNNLERFYYVPLLIILIKNTIRSM